MRPTEKGLYLRRRAQEIVSLADRTSTDFSHGDDIVAGDIHIGAGESASMRLISQRVSAFRRRYPPAVSIIDVVWKRTAAPTRAMSLFLESLRQ